MGDEGECGDEDRRGIHSRAPDQPDPTHAEDRGDTEDNVPGRVRDRVPAEGRPDVVRHEEARQCDDDQVVEEERPAGDESRGVVEGAADECGSATGLGQRGGALRV
jgi:hypothetical protein